eukprot:scaffold165_cov265-Prasinococcus_capsulatus_cf.AAC.1
MYGCMYGGATAARPGRAPSAPGLRAGRQGQARGLLVSHVRPARARERSATPRARCRPRPARPPAGFENMPRRERGRGRGSSPLTRDRLTSLPLRLPACASPARLWAWVCVRRRVGAA